MTVIATGFDETPHSMPDQPFSRIEDKINKGAAPETPAPEPAPVQPEPVPVPPPAPAPAPARLDDDWDLLERIFNKKR